MCALAPSHAIIPAADVSGVTLQSDGSLEFYGYNAPLFLQPVAIASFEIVQPVLPPYQWSIRPHGQLLSKSQLDFPAASWFLSVDAVSPDGSWLAGLQTEGTSDFILDGKYLVWRRGTNELLPVEPPPGQSGTQRAQGLSNEGDVIFSANIAGGETGSFVRYRTGGLLALPSLYPPEASTGPGTSPVFATAISADGQTIVGISGGGGTPGALPPRATLWKNGIAHELPAGGYSQSYARAVSADGRIVGGSVSDGTTTRAAVWVDGVLQQALTDDPLGTEVLQVVSGVGGDPAAWAALGFDWIALSDGVVRRFDAGFFESYGLSLTGSHRGVKLLATDDALYLVTSDLIPANRPRSPFDQLATHVFVLPTNYTYSPSVALDLSGDQRVTAADALLVINALNDHPNTPLIDLPALRQAVPQIDTNGDGQLSPADALRIINHLNDASSAQADSVSPAEGEPTPSQSALSTDDYFHLLGSKHPRRKASGGA